MIRQVRRPRLRPIVKVSLIITTYGALLATLALKVVEACTPAPEPVLRRADYTVVPGGLNINSAASTTLLNLNSNVLIGDTTTDAFTYNSDVDVLGDMRVTGDLTVVGKATIDGDVICGDDK